MQGLDDECLFCVCVCFLEGGSGERERDEDPERKMFGSVRLIFPKCAGFACRLLV